MAMTLTLESFFLQYFHSFNTTLKFQILKLSADPVCNFVQDANTLKLTDTYLSYKCQKKVSLKESTDSIEILEVDYINSYFTLGDKNGNGLEFHTFSELISYTTATYDVLTFYLTFILVIGNVLRHSISGEAERVILTEMPEPQDLMNLCEGIKLYRYKHDFER